MKYCYITFRSVTYAQRGEQVLQRGNIPSTLLRMPRWMEEQGCGYCLRLRAAETGKALNRLENARIPMRKVYRQTGDRQLEEWTQ